jgi:aldehyde:ferredoxin oxidoreductase
MPKRIALYKDHPVTHAYRNNGTPMMVDILNKAGGFPSRYWSQGSVPHAKISMPRASAALPAETQGLPDLFSGLRQIGSVQQGRHQGLTLEGPEYETIYAFGGLCMVDQIEEIVYLNDLCDRMGLDTMSSGNLAAFAIEARTTGQDRSGYRLQPA